MSLIVAFNVVLGVVLTDDYGASWDEPVEAAYGRRTLQAYVGMVDPTSDEIQSAHGPFFVGMTSLFSRLIHLIRPGWLLVESRQFVYWLSFQLAIVSLYALCLKFTDRAASLLATLLFATQPVLFGHAFINPKDVPFLGFFLTVVTLGFYTADAYAEAGKAAATGGTSEGSVSDILDAAKGDWQSTGAPRKALSLASLSLLLILLVDLALGIDVVVFATVRDVLANAYEGSGPELVNRIFNSLAVSASEFPRAYYLDFWATLYGRLRVPFIYLIILLGAVIATSMMPSAARRVWTIRRYRLLALASVMLGLTISLRVFGAFAGVLVSGYFLFVSGWRSARPLVILWSVAAATTLITWPFLWADPVGNALTAVRIMGRYPFLEAFLFRGQLVFAGELPWDYLPVLLAMQITEVVFPLVALGLYVAARTWRGARTRAVALGLIVLWFVFPIAGTIALRPSLTDNFRHFLYGLPPLFILASLGLNWLLAKLKSSAVKGIVSVALLAPGVVGIVNLHPYEYIYYNSFVGGVRGVEGRFELDYWCTSYREAVEYVNQIAPRNAVVWYSGAPGVLRNYARGDLEVHRWWDLPESDELDYALICSRANEHQRVFPESEVVAEIKQEGAVLSVVKSVAPGDPAR